MPYDGVNPTSCPAPGTLASRVVQPGQPVVMAAPRDGSLNDAVSLLSPRYGIAAATTPTPPFHTPPARSLPPTPRTANRYHAGNATPVVASPRAIAVPSAPQVGPRYVNATSNPISDAQPCTAVPVPVQIKDFTTGSGSYPPAFNAIQSPPAISRFANAPVIGVVSPQIVPRYASGPSAPYPLAPRIGPTTPPPPVPQFVSRYDSRNASPIHPAARLRQQPQGNYVGLFALQGTWRSSDGSMWVIDRTGRHQVNGEWKGGQFDIVKQAEGMYSRADGWKALVAGPAPMDVVWQMPGKDTVRWTRIAETQAVGASMPGMDNVRWVAETKAFGASKTEPIPQSGQVRPSVVFNKEHADFIDAKCPHHFFKVVSGMKEAGAYRPRVRPRPTFMDQPDSVEVENIWQP